uniref:Mu-like prophage host-nuclease inhibitor protein Gam n=1 Tax=Candidatus Kentrum sp. LPFa TaxID=2126335 RepID=A0A450WDP6_9GAMM|nr:MAG: Mu-like prophage host-nuclease inhibitor protein Gam [Candidatus Kentron sp. LPFa]VFK31002.1 MAG: Mu-like prophage host-nuclease inhibitor protein Gam [Candidatus Kentron sp. LPFa]
MWFLGELKNPEPELMYRDKDEVDKAIAECGAVQRRIDAINADINRRTAAIVASHEKDLTALSDEKKKLEAGIQRWCEKNRANILPTERKTARFLHGEVAWRAGRETVEVTGDDGKFEELIRTLKRKRLSRFIQIKHVIDKTAVAREPGKIKDIPGIEIKEGEETFAVRPFDMAVDKAA